MRKIIAIIKAVICGIIATASGKKWFLFLFLSSITLATPSDALLDAIRQVESGGRCVVGDGGKAVGVYQIHQIYVDDVNRILGKKVFIYADRMDEAKSRQMVRIYLTHYGKGLSLVQMARIHCGGPRGHKKQATLVYARKIERVMR